MNAHPEPRRHRWCLTGLVALAAWLAAVPLHTICHEAGHALTTLAVGGDVKKVAICGTTVYPQLSWGLQMGWWVGDGSVNSNMPDELWKTGLLQVMGYGTTTILSYLLLLVTRWVGRVWQVALLVIAFNFASGIFLHMGGSQVWGKDPPELLMGIRAIGLPNWALVTFLVANFSLFYWLFIRACLRLRRPVTPVTESAVSTVQSL